MVSIKIYIEGGGEGKDLDSRFREDWTKFFQAAGLAGKMPRPVRGKGRKNTCDLFCTAIQNAKPEELPLLLLDREDAIADGHTVWQRLKTRDGWDKPVKADDRHAYLMVQLMETWFLADPDTLKAHFGKNFEQNKIPAWPNFEAISKPIIFETLAKATDGQFAKGKVSFEVLSKTHPQKVAEKSPQAKRLLDFLQMR